MEDGSAPRVSRRLLRRHVSPQTPPLETVSAQWRARRLFEAIDRHLRRPKRHIVTPYRQAEFLFPHTLPDDPEWPTPTDTQHVRGLLNRLPHRQRVMAAFLAAEMVLPMWEARAAKSDEIDEPRRMLKMVRRWLDAPSYRETMADYLFARSVKVGGDEDYFSHPSDAAECAANAALATAYAAAADFDSADADSLAHLDAENRFSTALAVDYATDAVRFWFIEADGMPRQFPLPVDAVFQAPEELRDGFLARWWELCRCRLAFCDADRAVLE